MRRSIVHRDADPEASARAAAMAKFRNSGQVCISPTRFYVHESIKAPFEEAFVDFARGIVVGDGLKDGVTMGPMIRGSAVDGGAGAGRGCGRQGRAPAPRRPPPGASQQGPLHRADGHRRRARRRPHHGRGAVRADRPADHLHRRGRGDRARQCAALRPRRLRLLQRRRARPAHRRPDRGRHGRHQRDAARRRPRCRSAASRSPATAARADRSASRIISSRNSSATGCCRRTDVPG